ncbi:hypothetical protein [Vibrio diazotrophicus]|uniref:hypothetical protein n=1 Tax=Vibrio diazotrophicus TaxID=685 RepID=UPI00142DAC83|nr:hypothetical protein [Vibrio diazotrophicus]NIY94213.1 hypothetical protein [Vibrio diazotrophicus]
MRWKKLGKVYNIPDESISPYGLSHCSNPRAIKISDDLLRVYYCSRNWCNKSSVFAIDIDINTFEVKQNHRTPILTYGDEETFYSDGISLGGFYNINDELYITFMGWKTPPGQHWYGQIGRAVVTDDFNLLITEDLMEPMVPLDDIDSVSLSYPCVNILSDGSYEMWYGTTKSWQSHANSEMVHILKRAISSDGRHWDKTNEVIPYSEGVAQAFSSPTCIQIGNTLHMWFSYRSGTGEKYRIGHSYKNNDGDWILDLDNSGIDVSDDPNSWESEMLCYPFVFECDGEIYMLYNGNQYGKSGFGIAKLDKN